MSGRGRHVPGTAATYHIVWLHPHTHIYVAQPCCPGSWESAESGLNSLVVASERRIRLASPLLNLTAAPAGIAGRPTLRPPPGTANTVQGQPAVRQHARTRRDLDSGEERRRAGTSQEGEDRTRGAPVAGSQTTN